MQQSAVGVVDVGPHSLSPSEVEGIVQVGVSCVEVVVGVEKAVVHRVVAQNSVTGVDVVVWNLVTVQVVNRRVPPSV